MTTPNDHPAMSTDSGQMTAAEVEIKPLERHFGNPCTRCGQTYDPDGPPWSCTGEPEGDIRRSLREAILLIRDRRPVLARAILERLYTETVEEFCRRTPPPEVVVSDKARRLVEALRDAAFFTGNLPMEAAEAKLLAYIANLEAPPPEVVARHEAGELVEDARKYHKGLVAMAEKIRTAPSLQSAYEYAYELKTELLAWSSLRAPDPARPADVEGKELVEWLRSMSNSNCTRVADFIEALAAQLSEKDKEIERLKGWETSCREWKTLAVKFEDQLAAATARVGVLEKALAPFAEAARSAEIVGRPPFEFCAASDYEAARTAIKRAAPMEIDETVIHSRGSATWTYEYDHGPAWYVKIEPRKPPPYLRQIHVEAIIDVAADGSLAGIEIIDDKCPGPARLTTAPSDGKAATAEPGEGDALAKIVNDLARWQDEFHDCDCEAWHSCGCKELRDIRQELDFICSPVSAPPSAQPSKELVEAGVWDAPPGKLSLVAINELIIAYGDAVMANVQAESTEDSLSTYAAMLDTKRALAAALAQPPVTDAGKGERRATYNEGRDYAYEECAEYIEDVLGPSLSTAIAKAFRSRKQRARAEATEEKPLPSSEGDQ